MPETSSPSTQGGNLAARRVSRNDGWGRSSRFYVCDGERYPSVTTILQSVAKPALVNWAARTERELMERVSADLYEDIPLASPRMARVAYLATLRARAGKTKAHQRELTKAGDIGTQAHDLIEWHLRKDLKQEVGPEPKVCEKSLWAFMAYEDWRRAANLVPIWIEQAVYSKRYGYAGTMDWLGEIDGPDGKRVRVVGDWKTGKGIYPESLLQNAAYGHALCEMGHAEYPMAGLIVRLPKIETDPAFEVRFIPAEQQRGLFDTFLAVQRVWRFLEEQEHPNDVRLEGGQP